MKPRSSAAPGVVAALLLLPAVYVGGYFTMVSPSDVFPSIVTNDGEYDFTHYRYGGQVAETIFAPLEKLDRQVRVRTWAGPQAIHVSPPSLP